MKTERLFLGERYGAAVARAAELLKSGGIVGIPTETVYGLAALSSDERAIGKVFEAKGRPQDNPLIVHICDVSMLKEVAREIPAGAEACARAFWPGPFTMILKRTDRTAPSVSAGLDTVAVRLPSHTVARDIIAASGPLAAPSANLSGRPSPTSAQHVLDDLDGRIDAVVMGDDCAFGVESTVVTLAGETPRLLRPGAVTLEQLRAVLPGIEVDPAVLEMASGAEKPASPGMKYKHYAPGTETYLVEGTGRAFSSFVNAQTDCAAVCFVEEAQEIAVPKLCYGSGRKEDELAKQLFAVLRQVDSLGVSKVYVHAPSKAGVGLAVYNRLIRAASFRVIAL